MQEGWTPYKRNPENDVRYWAVPGTPGFTHRIGGLEKSAATGAISNDPANHHSMVETRARKVEKIAFFTVFITSYEKIVKNPNIR